nr:zinc finger, CCHC-type [Tanacetum cinerariifolium]
MGDKNPIRTIGDYSKPSHEGYRNTIELPAGNNVVPLRSDTIRNLANGKKRKRIWNDKQHSVSTTLKPSGQEEFENLVMNFILDQVEKVKKLEEYMCVIRSDFMQLSLEVIGKLKEEVIFDEKKLGSSYEVSLDDSWRTI